MYYNVIQDARNCALYTLEAYSKITPVFKNTARKKRSNKLSAYLALTAITFIWALAGPVIKLTLNDIPPMQFLFLRMLLVGIVLLPTTILQAQRDPFRPEEIPTLITLGLLSQSSLALTFIGYKYSTALDASVITLISPILSVAAGHYFYKEKLNQGIKIGVFLASVGTALVIMEPLLLNGTLTLQAKELRVFGNLMILAGVLAFLLYTLWSKFAGGEKSAKIGKMFRFMHLRRLKRGRSDLMITFITFYVGLATNIPLMIMETKGVFGTPHPFSITSLTPTAYAGIAYMAIFSSIIAYTLFEWALNTVSVADTALFNYLNPVFTLPMAYILLGEIPTQITLIGAGIIAVGVIIAEHQKS